MQVITLSQDDLSDIISTLKEARVDGRRVRVAVEDGFKIDVSDGQGWSLPYGTDTTGRS